MNISSWLQVVQFAPSSVVIASNCGNLRTTISSNEKGSLACCNRGISINAEIKCEQGVDFLISNNKINLLIVIRIICNFSPSVGWNIKCFSLIGIWAGSTNSQWSSVNLCQCTLSCWKVTCLKVTHFLNFLEILKKYEKYLLRVSRSRVHKLRFIRPSRNRQTDRKTRLYVRHWVSWQVWKTFR